MFFPKQFTVRGSQFFLKMCPPFLSLLVSALFRWPCSISIHLSPRSVICGLRPFALAMQHFYSFVSQVCHWWCPPFSAGHVAFLFICLPGLSLLVSFFVGHVAFLFTCPPGLSLLVSALFRWPCRISIHLSPRSVTAGVRPFPLAMQNFYSFVSQVCHCWCPPFSVGHVAFLFICLPGLSLVVSALFRWPCSISIHLSPRSVAGDVRPFPLACSISIHLSPRSVAGDVRPFPLACSISIHLSPRSVTAGVRPFPLAMKHFYSFVSQVCHWWCPPLSAGHVAFLFICLPGLSLPVSALFRWPCTFSIHLSPRSVAAGVRPFPLAMQHFYSFVSQVCHCWCVTVSVLSPFCFLLSPFLSPVLSPFLLVIVSALSSFLSPCVSGLVSLLVGQCVRLVSFLSPFVSGLVSLLVGQCVRLVSLCFLVVSLLVGHCVCLVSLFFLSSAFLSLFIVSALSPFLSPFVSSLVSLLVSHCVRLVSLLFPSCLPCCLPSCWSLCPPCLPSCLPLSPFLFVIVSVLSPFSCLCLPSCLSLCSSCLSFCLPSCWVLCPPCLSFCSFCLPSCLPSCWSLCPPCLPSC